MKGVQCPIPNVSCQPRSATKQLPLIIQPTSESSATREFLAEQLVTHRDFINSCVHKNGAVLFRGFDLEHAEDFNVLVSTIEPRLLDYIEGQSQRAKVVDRVYTSTEYPADQDITLHNELSYANNPPKRIYFFCNIPADQGGQTPIADGREAYREMNPRIRDKFSENQIRYVKNMHSGKGYGKSWQAHFETDDKSIVESYLEQGEVEYEWLSNGSLRTIQIRPAVICHPETEEMVWFNQADLWHYSNLGSQGIMLKRILGEENLPTNAYFGDGSAIPLDDLDAIRTLFWKRASIFSWKKGDFLMADNKLVTHGRKAYTGDRKVLVALA